MLVHGWARNAEWMKNPLTEPHEGLPGLAKHYRVIALDCRGHGKNGKPHDPKQYGVEMAEDVVRLLDHLKIKKAHVVGYSMGSMIAGKLLAAHPDRLLSVTFGGAAPVVRVPTAERFLGVLEATADALEQGKGMGPLVIALTPPGQPKLSEAQIAAGSKALLEGQDVKALAAAMRTLKDLAVTEAQLRANKVPVCFVYGSREYEGTQTRTLKPASFSPGPPFG